MHGDDTRPWTFYAFAAFFTLFVLFLYGPMIVIYILSFQGPNGGMTFPLNGVSLHWFDALISQTRVGDIAGSFVRSIGLAAIVAVVTVVLSVLAGLAFRRRFRGSAFAFYLAIASLIMPGLFVGLGIALTFRLLGLPTELVHDGARRPAHLDAAVRASDHVRRARPLQSLLRGGGDRSRRHQLAEGARGHPADPAARHHRRGAVRLHPVLRRDRAHRAGGRQPRTRCRSRSGR